jgi:four helix bundle protein
MQDFRKLEVWQRGQGLALSVYRATATYPNSERFGLTSQMRRAAASIPANIAEGCGRAASTEFRQFLHIAAGSANELICFVLLSQDLGLLAPKQAEVLERTASDVKQMLTRLIQRINATKRLESQGGGSCSDGKR